MNAFILCDASFDNDLKIASLAGSVVMGDITERFTHIRTEIENSHQAEMLAISFAIKNLSNRIKVSGSNPITRVHIFTDSQAAILMNKKNNNAFKTFRDFRADITSRLSNLGIKATFHKVKGHQKASVATHIEAKHNEIDKLASDNLKEFKSSIFTLKNTGKYFGIILDAKPSPKYHVSLIALGKKFAELGKIPRILFEGNQQVSVRNHPFLKAYHYALNKSTFEVIEWDKQYLQKPDPVKNCCGLDRVLLRKYRNDKKFEHTDFYKRGAQKAGAVSRVIYGLQEEPLKNQQPSKRVSEPSSFLINLSSLQTQEGSMGYLLNKFEKFVDITTYKSMKDVANEFSIDRNKELDVELNNYE
jgi:ribonuclease HI